MSERDTPNPQAAAPAGVDAEGGLTGALAEFDAVCATLTGFDGPDTEWADGFLTAVAAGPRAIDTDEWLEPLCGDAFDRAFADPADAARARSVLQARLKTLRQQLDPEALLDDPEQLRLAPVMLEIDDEDRARAREIAAQEGTEGEALQQMLSAMHTGAQWSSGFLAAVDHFQADWTLPDEFDNDEEFAQAFAGAMDVVAAPLLDPQGEDYQQLLKEQWLPQDDGTLPTRDELINEVLFAVQDLRTMWVEAAPKPATRRVEAQPGRNDPCPCGSGKKWKKCHGAA